MTLITNKQLCKNTRPINALDMQQRRGGALCREKENYNIIHLFGFRKTLKGGKQWQAVFFFKLEIDRII